jgi:hypothetical protein
MDPARQAYDELYVYTMGHGDPAFILQYVVDAFAAQTATKETKPITLTFALVGLYLHIEKQFSGRQVQRAHMRLGAHKQQWPNLSLPDDCGAMGPGEVMSAEAGPARDAAIDAWCQSVWTAFHANRGAIAAWLEERGVV